MTPVVAFFNTALGAGTTTLTYHVAWMPRELGTRVLVVDLDPQANLTTSFLADDAVESLWQPDARQSVYGALAALFEGEGDIVDAHVVPIDAGLDLVAGDLRLARAEQELSTAWGDALDESVRGFRVTTAFATVARRAAEQVEADLILLDVGPNLGAINRAAMVASSHIVVPMAPDLYSLQGPEPRPDVGGVATGLGRPQEPRTPTRPRPARWRHGPDGLRGAAARHPHGPRRRRVRPLAATDPGRVPDLGPRHRR